MTTSTVSTDEVMLQLAAGPLTSAELSNILRRPAQLVDEQLSALVDSGYVRMTNTKEAPSYTLSRPSHRLTTSGLNTSIATGRIPLNMDGELKGYESTLRRFRETCMTTRTR